MDLNFGSGLQPSLTMTERRVGSLVAAGYADPEIAARLLLSEQTVQWSVAKLCRTLDLGSRHELAARLGESRGDWGAAR
jgi:DNA-binding NarL/FixJ family response regulator